MHTNLTTTNVIHLPDGTAQVTISSISAENGAWSVTDYLWLAVVALFAFMIFYPILKWLYQRLRPSKAAGKK
jgi:hypothetical protein